MSLNRQVVSKIKHWCTPPVYIDAVKDVFGGIIHLDPCSNEHSMVGAEIEYRLPIDGLQQSWDSKTIYLNPPYGFDTERKTSIRHWLLKARDANRFFKSQVIALIPVATNTRHWQNNIFLTAKAICFLDVPRLKFWINGESDNKGAPMACAVVYWGNDFCNFDSIFCNYGKVIEL